jgi:microsomal dipeptidase-like Zn-dependent dipeptidase
MIENNIKNINNILNTQLSNSDNRGDSYQYKESIEYFNEIIKKIKEFHIIESHQQFLISKTSTEKDFHHYHTLKGAMVFLKEIHKLHLFALLGLTDYLNDFEKKQEYC